MLTSIGEAPSTSIASSAASTFSGTVMLSSISISSLRYNHGWAGFGGGLSVVFFTTGLVDCWPSLDFINTFFLVLLFCFAFNALNLAFCASLKGLRLTFDEPVFDLAGFDAASGPPRDWRTWNGASLLSFRWNKLGGLTFDVCVDRSEKTALWIILLVLLILSIILIGKIYFSDYFVRLFL